MDKELSGHIRAVFDAYEEPYDAALWQRLQRKRRGRIVALYLKRAGAAAAVAILVAAGVLLLNRRSAEKDPFLAGAGLQEGVVSPDDGTVSSEGTVSSNPAEELVSSGVPDIAEETTSASGTFSPAISPRNERGALSEAVAPEAGKPVREGRLAETEALPAGHEAVTRPEVPSSPTEAVARSNGKAPAAGQAPDSGEASLAGQAPGSGEVPAAGQAPAASEAPVLAGNQREREETSGFGNTYSNGRPVNESDERRGRFSVGFVTTSLMNYADGNTASDVHFGAGITSGWKLNDRLSVHSGVILAENSLSLDKSNSSVQAMASFAPNRAETTELSAVGKNNIVQNISPNSMDVNLLVMDIPLNVTYRVEVGRSNLLLTGGLSSFAYLDQEYSYHNTMQLYTDASVDAPEPVVRNEKAFSHFDFAKQLNIAVGTELPLGKGSVLILEPYVKYPLGELTSEHIRFGSAGMNLRLSFGNK